jgi:hypothetical protein
VAGIDIDDNDMVSFLVAHGDGGFNDQGAYLVQVNEFGALYSIQLSDDLYSCDLNKALHTNSGDVVAVGKERVWVDSLQIHQNQLAFYRFSPQGDVLATAHIPPDSTSFTNSNAYDAVIDESGNVLVSCRLHPNHNEIVKMDLNGNILDRILLAGNIPNANWLYWVHLSHIPGSDHTLAVYQHYVDLPQPNTSVINIAMISTAGISYQSFDCSLIRTPHSILEVDNDLIIAAIRVTPYTRNCIFRFSYSQAYEVAWIWHDPEF